MNAPKTTLKAAEKKAILDYCRSRGTRDPERVRLWLKHSPVGSVNKTTIRELLAEELADEEFPQVAATPLSTPKAKSRATAQSDAHSSSNSTVGIKGINLAGARISARKPSDTVKAKLYGLKRNQGYPLEALAESWCVSIDTLRNHARRSDCLRYVEVSPGEWVQCILHPDTAAQM